MLSLITPLHAFLLTALLPEASLMTFPRPSLKQQTVTSLCKDTCCKNILASRTMQSVSKYCVLTTVAPVSQDNAI